MQRNFICILLSLGFLAIGSGLLEFVHNKAHQIEDARVHHEHSAPLHDESNCAIHAQLHLPMMQQGIVPIFICIGLFVAFLTQLPTLPLPKRTVTRPVCRGPPIA